MHDMSSTDIAPTLEPDQLAGTARLQVVIPVALISFFYANLLDYALPLYLGAREAAAEAAGGSFPRGMYATAAIWRVTPWIIGPIPGASIVVVNGLSVTICGSTGRNGAGGVYVPVVVVAEEAGRFWDA